MSASPRYLLDTSAVIDEPDTSELPAEAELMICTITLAELNAGIYFASNPVTHSERVTRLQQVSRRFAPIPFTMTDAHMYGRMAALLVAEGRHPRGRQLDLLIASVAAVRQMPLVTRNAGDLAGLETVLDVVALG